VRRNVGCACLFTSPSIDSRVEGLVVSARERASTIALLPRLHGGLGHAVGIATWFTIG
jgi:hypothetical protein